ncbi:hypothetical protein BKA61DRAFT_594946 [Leptodontidium sp. MPI-SDFR-AT-0119]|nr:hypothetical protein BKA61DRAFT_594946 [Leptodontidium sp. MPI-SDFR-AT-0119]
MSSCSHSTIFYFLPPTLPFLKENFPTLIPDSDIDRMLLRCRLCDLIDTQAAADMAEACPNGLEEEADLERQICELKQAITEGIKTDTENELPRLQKKLNDAVNATDQRILDAWKIYWAVWGPGEGPDREDEEDYGEDIVIEFPPKEGGKPEIATTEDIKIDIEIEIPSEKEVKPEIVPKVDTPAKTSVKKSARKPAKKPVKKPVKDPVKKSVKRGKK